MGPMHWIRGTEDQRTLGVLSLRLFTSAAGRHPPGGEGGLLTALDVDRAELLHAAQASGRQVGVGQVCGLLATPGTAGGREARVAGQRGAPCGRVVLH